MLRHGFFFLTLENLRGYENLVYDELLDDLIACGVTVINLQDRVNGIDEIRKRCRGRIAVDLDIDRQEVTRSGSPKDVEELIREAVMKLGSPRDGLSLIYDLYPGIPIRNDEVYCCTIGIAFCNQLETAHCRNRGSVAHGIQGVSLSERTCRRMRTACPGACLRRMINLHSARRQPIMNI